MINAFWNVFTMIMNAKLLNQIYTQQVRMISTGMKVIRNAYMTLRPPCMPDEARDGQNVALK